MSRRLCGGVVAHVIIVSAQSKELDLGPVGTGDWGLGLGLDNYLLLTWAPLIHSPRAYF